MFRLDSRHSLTDAISRNTSSAACPLLLKLMNKQQIECVLKKKEAMEWSTLEGAKKPIAPRKVPPPQQPSAPLPTAESQAQEASMANGQGATAAESAAAQAVAASRPTPYATHRDWEAIDKEITKELDVRGSDGSESRLSVIGVTAQHRSCLLLSASFMCLMVLHCNTGVWCLRHGKTGSICCLVRCMHCIRVHSSSTPGALFEV